MGKNHYKAKELADRLESASAMQKKTERNRIFMEVTYPFVNDIINALRHMSEVIDITQTVCEGRKPDPVLTKAFGKIKDQNII